ncbi:MAG: hypothetical protein ACQEVA_02175 [Myxococcota bacterium]
MSDTESELSDDELDSLLSDLESKASGSGSKASVSVDDEEANEDIEAFLANLDESEGAGEASSAPAKTADRDRDAELDAKFAELGDLEPANLPAKTEEKDASAAKSGKGEDEKGKDKKGGKAVASGDSEDASEDKPVSKRRKYGLAALKVLAVSLPSLLFIWVLGAFLGNWVSAAWLIAIVSVVFGLGVPAVARHYVKKGKYMWWAIGSSILLVAALTVPMPGQAGNAIQKYGHWPVSFVAEVVGWDVDNPIVKGSSLLSEQIGSWLPGAAEDLEGKQLGTEHELDVPIAEQPEAAAPEEGG